MAVLHQQPHTLVFCPHPDRLKSSQMPRKLTWLVIIAHLACVPFLAAVSLWQMSDLASLEMGPLWTWKAVSFPNADSLSQKNTRCSAMCQMCGNMGSFPAVHKHSRPNPQQRQRLRSRRTVPLGPIWCEIKTLSIVVNLNHDPCLYCWMFTHLYSLLTSSKLTGPKNTLSRKCFILVGSRVIRSWKSSLISSPES